MIFPDSSDQKVVFDFADCLCFRFVNVLVYYGLSLNISDFGMNIYLTQMIFGLVEMPARTVTLFTLNRSRRISQLAFLATGGLACLLTTFIPDGKFKTRHLLKNHGLESQGSLRAVLYTVFSSLQCVLLHHYFDTSLMLILLIQLLLILAPIYLKTSHFVA